MASGWAIPRGESKPKQPKQPKQLSTLLTNSPDYIAAIELLTKARADEKRAKKEIADSATCTVSKYVKGSYFASKSSRTCLGNYYQQPEGSAREMYSKTMCDNCKIRLPLNLLNKDAVARRNSAKETIAHLESMTEATRSNVYTLPSAPAASYGPAEIEGFDHISADVFGSLMQSANM